MQSVDELIVLRKTLHQTPELSNQEQATAVRIFNEFQAFSPDEVITISAERGWRLSLMALKVA